MKFENVSKVSVSSIYVIEINIATSLIDWVLDTGSCAHICTNMYALRNKRKLRNKEVQLRVVFTKRAYILELENIYFVPSISRNRNG